MFRRLLGLYFQETCHARTWAFLAAMLVLTAVFAAGGAGGASGGIQVYNPIRLSVSDEDNTMLSGAVIDQLGGISTLDHVYVEPLEQALARLETGETLLVLRIPAGFYARSRDPGLSTGVEVWFNDRMPTEAAVFVRFLENAADSVSVSKAALFAFEDEVAVLIGDETQQCSESDAAAIAIIMKLVARKTFVRIQEAARLDTGVFILCSLTCLYTLQTSLLLLPLVRRERASGVYDRLLIRGVPWWKPALARTLVGLVWLAAGTVPLFTVLFRAVPGVSPGPPAAAVVLLYTAGALLVQAWGPVSARDDTALLAAWAGMLALLLAGGCIYPFRLLPAWMRAVGGASPARWAFSALYDTFTGQTASWTGIGILAALAVPPALLAWPSWRRSRWGS
ncbi:MAG: ABC transporter permease [Clostridia bacterium]|nr:ABC transporter permease [Clostridia bacterium]